MTITFIITTPTTIGTAMAHAGISSIGLDVGIIMGTPIMVACDKHMYNIISQQLT